MKAITIHQPWASMIALGEKTIECRSWRTHHRGPLLICASNKKPPLFEGYRPPYGLALAVVDVVDCRLLVREDMAAAGMVPEDWPYVEGGYGWILANAKEIEPFKVKGYQGIYNVECDPAPLPSKYENHFAWWDKHGPREKGPSKPAKKSSSTS
jgi:hypothetical protein